MVATLGIALPEIRQTFSLTELQAGSLFSVMMLIAAVTSAIAGRLADRIGRKTVLITGLSLLAAGFGCAGISRSSGVVLPAPRRHRRRLRLHAAVALRHHVRPLAQSPRLGRESRLCHLWHRRRHRRRAGKPDHRRLRLARCVCHRRYHRRRRHAVAALLDSRHPSDDARPRNQAPSALLCRFRF